MAVIEQYLEDAESPFDITYFELDTSYRGASEYLIDEVLDLEYFLESDNNCEDYVEYIIEKVVVK